MGVFSFVRDAGQRVFGRGDSKPEVKQQMVEAPADMPEEERNLNAFELMDYVGSLGLPLHQVRVAVRDGKVTLRGQADTQEAAEKAVLALGNVEGIAEVDNQLEVKAPAPEAKFHTVAKGDTLSKIAQQHYGQANRYQRIFEANQPMLSDPDKIYPGQVLRIPQD